MQAKRRGGFDELKLVRLPDSARRDRDESHGRVRLNPEPQINGRLESPDDQCRSFVAAMWFVILPDVAQVCDLPFYDTDTVG